MQVAVEILPRSYPDRARAAGKEDAGLIRADARRGHTVYFPFHRLQLFPVRMVRARIPPALLDVTPRVSQRPSRSTIAHQVGQNDRDAPVHTLTAVHKAAPALLAHPGGRTNNVD